MNDHSNSDEQPPWDVALAALLREEALKTGHGVSLTDILRLAETYAIRFDDLMATLFALVLNQEWRYINEQGALQTITPHEVELLHKNGRIHLDDLTRYRGFWIPHKAR